MHHCGKLRAESSSLSVHPPHLPINNHWCEADAVLVTSVRRVVELPLEGLIVLRGGRRRAQILGRGAEAGGGGEVPSFRDRVFLRGGSTHRRDDRGWSVVEVRRSPVVVVVGRGRRGVLFPVLRSESCFKEAS